MLQHESDPGFEERFHAVKAANGRGVFASTGPNFAGSTFGRDSAEVGEDVVEFDPVIPREVELTLASLQGLGYDDLTEEEPGKIHHLYRAIEDMETEDNLNSYRQDAERWGSDGRQMIFYGSIDATPLFLRLGIKHAKTHGDGILYERVVGRDGRERSFADHMLMANDWMLRKLQTSDLGLVEFKHLNPRGEHIQAWKDSVTAYTHIDGTPINYTQPIAALEVQGYAYDALKGMSELFPGSVPDGLTEDFGRRIIEDFWLEDQQMFAQAIDRDEAGRPRHVRTPTSNSGLLLDSDVLLDMPDTSGMVEATVDMLMGPDFLTSAGPRCRSLQYRHLVDYADYHGSYSVWFKEVNDIMRGMEKHGLMQPAKQLARGIVATVQEMGEYYEFAYVDEKGQLVMPDSRSGIFADPRGRIPEPGQAWTISAFVRSLRLLQADEEVKAA